MIAAPPGWNDKVKRALAILDCACEQSQREILATGYTRVATERKRDLAYRVLGQLMAMRPSPLETP